MKTMFTSLVVCFCFLLSAQEKGASPLTSPAGRQETQNSSLTTGSTYAVVVGISDYQNPDIPDLRFADKDAEAFVNYLKSPAGGSLPDERLKVLTNQNATTAQIAAALEWLVEVSGEGDQAIIYFSGHGDVETKTMFQLGYLLTWDSPAMTYVAGAFPLSYLQAVVSTLALQNKSEVALITDACRAGKLAGTSVGGAQITNANLSRQFANEVKILSCQPDEFSIEGEQWGGGRGVFSYHLVDGLYGLADGNGDGQVNLFEIGRYLEDKVSTEAAPHSQFPMIAGSKTSLMAQVDAGALALLKEQRSKETPVLTGIDSKGFEEGILAGIDSVWQQKYEQFVAAVDAGQLLDAPVGQVAAYDLYLELSKVIELKKLHGTMQRNLAAALQDEAQQSINAYLAANPTELGKRYAAETDYERYPRYLRKAAEILGEENFYYPYVMAKLHYFEGLQLRLEADNKTDGDSIAYQQAIEKQLQALAFQEYSPFVLNELGVLHTRLKMSEKAVGYYEKAIELSPEWGLPYVNLCLEYFYNNEQEKALQTGDKAIERMPDYPQLYNLLGWVNSDPTGYRDKRNWKRKGVELKEDFFYDHDNTSTLSEKKSTFEKTVRLLKKAISLDSAYASAHSNLGKIYNQIGLLDEAAYHLTKSIRIDSTNHIAFLYLSEVLLGQSKYGEAEAAVHTAIDLAKEKAPFYVPLWYNDLGIIYNAWGKTDKALEAFQEAIVLAPGYVHPYGNSADIYTRKGDYQKAEWYVLKNRELGSKHPLPYFNIGSFYKTIKRYEDAEHMYLKAIGIHPEYTKAITGLVELYQDTKQFEKGLKFLKTELEKDPNNLYFLVTMETLYFHLGDLEKAEEYAEKVNEKFKESVSLAGDLAYQYYTGKYFKKAAYYLEKHIATAPNDFHNDYNMSCCYALLGKKKVAIDWLSKAIEKGYKKFNQISTNPDFTSIRDEPAFKALMEKHFPGQVFEGKSPAAKNDEPIYYRENCLLLAEYYESEGEHERAKWLREKAAALQAAEIKRP